MIDRTSIIVFVVILLSITTHEASAQYIQFSSAGQTNNLDSVYNGYAARHKPQLNSSLYRHKYDSGYSARMSQYQGKYDDAVGSKVKRYNAKSDSVFGRIQQYRSKYADVKNLDKASLSGQLDKLKKQYTLDPRIQKIARYAPQVKNLRDQLMSGKLKLDSGTVFNNRIMKSYMDSVMGKLPPKPVNPFQETSEDQLVKQLNQQLRNQADSVRDSTKWVGEAKKKKQWVDLNYASLKAEDGSDLKPMVTSLVKTHLLKHIDSSRLANLKATRMKMEQTEKDGRQSVAKFREKETFWKKSYLEGIMSMAANQSGTFQFSPAWAYHIVPSWSVGGGPNLTVSKKKESSNVKLDVGARLLTKYEMLHRTLYLQLEDRINPAAVSKENNPFTQHAFLGGAGWVIPFFSPITLNVAVMYKFYTNGAAQNDGSPWVFRIGFSTNKKTK